MKVGADKLVLVGGGGHALVVAEAARALGIEMLGVMDDRADAPAVRRLGLRHLGGLFSRGGAEGGAAVICVGDGALRGRVSRELGGVRWSAPMVASGAYVAETAEMGAGVFVGVRAVVHSFARIGAHAIVNTGAIVEHECEIGECAHVAPGAVLAGNVRVGRETLIGVGARVIPGVTIGAGCVVGAGAVVVRDVPDGTKVAGVPARRM
ncbi:MAG: NeuD/PglB/VioB family sugar acetyltransferase [Phycisphaerales bacterium]|nr:NeuD/PglB/VioB family sugar acetyltransferase [Planctomycetota bacterium]